MEFLKIINETEEEFEKIAQTLFDNYSIEAHNIIYRFVEIEFYWNSSTHVDKSTYQRKHVNPKTGEWFFHYSGVDIALENEKGGYGGILIRSIRDIKNNRLVKGPMVCAMTLFSGTNAFSKSISTYISPYEFEKSQIIKRERVGLGQNAKENGADKLNYAFFIEPKMASNP